VLRCKTGVLGVEAVRGSDIDDIDLAAAEILDRRQDLSRKARAFAGVGGGHELYARVLKSRCHDLECPAKPGDPYSQLAHAV